MAYCDTTDVQNILSQALTSASTGPTSVGSIQPGNLLNIGKTLNLNVIPQGQIDYYIQLADGHVNAALSQQYITPLLEAADIEMSLVNDIDEYNTVVMLNQVAILSPGDKLIFTDGTNSERHTVLSIDDFETIELTDPLMNLYSASNTRVLRVKFPDPIPYISARLAASAVYNKYFMAQAEPGDSKYGDMVRKIAIEELNNIREGRTILHGVRRIGWRFANPELIERYGLKGPWDQDGTRPDQDNK